MASTEKLLFYDRNEAIQKLSLLEGSNLRPLAEDYGITIFKEGAGFNKGWVGHTIEAHLGLPRNSLRSGDFYDVAGPWELKTVSLREVRGIWVPKETLAITMISEKDHLPEFKESHLYAKLRRLVVVGRAFVNREETEARILYVHPFDLEALENSELLREIQADYEEVRSMRNKPEGYYSLSGKMGKWIQPRTKGPGHGSRSRAFYARKNLVAVLLKLD